MISSQFQTWDGQGWISLRSLGTVFRSIGIVGHWIEIFGVIGDDNGVFFEFRLALRFRISYVDSSLSCSLISLYIWDILWNISHDKQSKKIRTILVKVSSISNNRARQSYPMLSWLMFHKISQMYRDIRAQEIEEATELILNIRDQFNSNNTTVSSPRTPNLLIEQPKMPLDPK